MASSAGLVLDEWQRFALEVALGERADGKWAAFEVGAIVARQNGKGSLAEARELAGLFLFDEQLILHSAHEFKTAQEAFRRLLALVQNTPDLDRRVMRVRTSHGEEGIELKTGQRIRFVARSSGSGRGFTGDCLVLDEAFNLPVAIMAALLPTLSSRPNPQIWYTTTTPAEVDDKSAQIRNARRRAMSDEPGRLAWIEWSCPEDVDPGDPEAWALANPSLGIRISEEFILAEKDTLPAEAFLVERLGVWPDDDLANQVIPADAWARSEDAGAQLADPVSLCVDVTPDRSAGAIAAAGAFGDRTAIEVIESRPGTEWIVDRLAQLVHLHQPARIVLCSGSPAESLLVDLAERGLEVERMSTAEQAQAAGMLFDGIVNDEVRHLGQSALNVALVGARQRTHGEAWTWSRKNSGIDICPLVAATMALWAHLSAPPPVDALSQMG